MTTRGRGKITPGGCILFVIAIFVLLIGMPLAALKYQNDNLQSRVEELEKP